MSVACTHPKEQRSLLGGYDVVCGRCEQTIGRVALFPCAVLTAAEADAVADALFIEDLGHVARGAAAKLELAARGAQA